MSEIRCGYQDSISVAQMLQCCLQISETIGGFDATRRAHLGQNLFVAGDQSHVLPVGRRHHDICPPLPEATQTYLYQRTVHLL